MEQVNITIIGAGVVGLSIAAELSRHYKDILVLERHNTFGQETSSRNSEVIHSGIYYPQKSLKALLCIEGAAELYNICERHSIPYKKIGKLIVATEQSEICEIEKLYKNAQANNVSGISILEKNEIKKIEPNIYAIAALYSPNTGIIDSHSLMKHLFNKATSNGVLFSFNSEVVMVNKETNGFVVGISQDNYMFKSRIVINSAGLFSDHIAELAGINLDDAGYKIKFCKGSYFSYSKPSPIKTLVYPVPHSNLTGLGVHATLDIGGRLRFGPDVEYVNEIDYRVDIRKKTAFYESAIKFIPKLDIDSLVPDMAGIRPKLQGPNDPVKDFIIREEIDKGLEGLINLIGIESPGLTAASAIAKFVCEIIKGFI